MNEKNTVRSLIGLVGILVVFSASPAVAANSTAHVDSSSPASQAQALTTGNLYVDANNEDGHRYLDVYWYKTGSHERGGKLGAIARTTGSTHYAKTFRGVVLPAGVDAVQVCTPGPAPVCGAARVL